MEAAFCVETLEDALARHGKPDIFNTDQGSQFTGQAFTGVLADNGIAISMRSASTTERWRTVERPIAPKRNSRWSILPSREATAK